MVAGSEQAEVEDVDYYQIVSPVEQVEDKEDSWEEVHGNPEKLKKIRWEQKRRTTKFKEHKKWISKSAVSTVGDTYTELLFITVDHVVLGCISDIKVS